MKDRKRWSESELNLLERFYSKIRLRIMTELFPDRGLDSIRKKAKRLGLPTYSERYSRQELFIKQAQRVHKNKYDYVKVNYLHGHTHVIIICKIHGEFSQSPSNHLYGRGCPKCGSITTGNKIRLTTTDFVNRAKKIHNFKYTYEKTNYIEAKSNVIITCCKHGDFEQLPSNHLAGAGCKQCRCSRGEKIIVSWFMDNNIRYETQYIILECKNNNPLPFDFAFWIKNKLYLLEYHGIQHFKYIPFFHKGTSTLAYRKKLDTIKRKFCYTNNISLLVIKYTDYKDIKRILQNYVESVFHKSVET